MLGFAMNCLDLLDRHDQSTCVHTLLWKTASHIAHNKWHACNFVVVYGLVAY